MEKLYQLFLKSTGVSTDTRSIQQGNMFFALKGGNFDGNKYAKQALEDGASFAIIDNIKFKIDDRTILVENVLETLQLLSKYHRSQLKIPIIGITGSNGKTTTKELLNEVLKQAYNVLSTRGNLNNHIGVPLTLLSIKDEHDIAVVEMGANHIGEIAELCDLVQPDYGVVTNIGKAHLEGFGGLDGVIKTKKALYESVFNNNGLVFVNEDNKLLYTLTDRQERKTFSSRNTKAEIQGELIKQDPFVVFKYKENNYTSELINTNLVGGYNFENMLASVLVGRHFGVNHKSIKKALEEYNPTNNRSQIVKTNSNTVIMDAYNANPTSMKSALESLKTINANNKYFILGDMLEMGKESQSEHLDVLRLLSELDLQNGILVGKEFKKCEEEFPNYKFIENTKNVIAYLTSQNLEGTLVLVKGSRGINLDPVLNYL